MARTFGGLGSVWYKPKKRRKGIHSKTKQSKNKNSKNYKKVYRGQGR